MSQTPTEHPTTAPPVASAVPAVLPAASPRSVTWLLSLGLLVAALALVMSGLLWQKLSFTQQEFARRSQDSANQAQAARNVAGQAEALSQELQARLTVAELRLSEVSLQRSQLEELMLTLSRSRDDNLVQDLEAALRLALQQAQLTGSAQPLVSALQAADQRIARAAQPRLNPVQRAIARDIERIQTASLADIPALALRLDELARQVDEWPVLNAVGPGRGPTATMKNQVSTELAGAAAEGESAAASSPDAVVPVASLPSSAIDAHAVEHPPADSGLSQGWGRVSAVFQDFWGRIWADVTRSGRELVRVSRIDRPEAALLAPEQAFFLRENLKLKLLNARLGLLARHMVSSQADVAAVELALERYFDTTAPTVAGAQRVLAGLRNDLVDNNLPRPDETLVALAAAAGGR
ncbi:MAG: uroporphyrinogen-III C-methyltransferase [Hydrogenophaga sp.]|uniref:uroporphyrinogen-III C-methyltransferase n=1 Tax=Hydrogenophaga sp. TaxID=1904254 RepID=UPI00276AC9AD|nr:uroporphyrinogen-III C-methyltransferase [Hydrogenophaga sp.]MDP2418368.1 uroporphyrinogen-III C-methyltransferase [Hydrogenophaga sp.]MDZ4187151.1 uroporphyrinogen-III C-methyltransferase [Hydrogenophaga sp.]